MHRWGEGGGPGRVRRSGGLCESSWERTKKHFAVQHKKLQKAPKHYDSLEWAGASRRGRRGGHRNSRARSPQLQLPPSHVKILCWGRQQVPYSWRAVGGDARAEASQKNGDAQKLYIDIYKNLTEALGEDYPSIQKSNSLKSEEFHRRKID